MVRCYSIPPRETGNNAMAIDSFVNSENVQTLNMGNYQSYLTRADVGLVMFYIRGNKACEWTRKHFSKAAKKTKGHHHAYAAVDCIPEFELCVQEDVTNFPCFKMYAKGIEVDFQKDHKKFLYKDMQRWVENHST